MSDTSKNLMFNFDFSYTRYILLGLVGTLSRLTHDVKAFIVGLVTAVGAYYAGIQLYLFAIGALVVADVVTGIWASFKQGEKFSSKKLGRGLIQKTVIYLIIMAASFEIGKVIQSAIGNETYWLTWILTLLILVYELTSVIENIVIINPQFYFLKRFSGLFEKVVNNQMDSVEERLGKLDEPKEETPEETPAEPLPKAEE